jgi:DNA-directed DNA polymerase III PolC
MQPKFIHLRVHTEFSLIDGLVKIKPLVKTLTELQMPAVAVTDHVNLFGLIKMYKTATSQGIKPIAGADVLIFNSDEPDNPYRLTLLAQNHKGYVTLTELVSQAYQKGQSKDGVPMIRREWIEQNHDGLIVLSGAMQGDIGRALIADKKDDALHFAMYWQKLFPNRFYLELQRVGKPNEENYIAAAIDVAIALNLPVVATNDVRFLKQSEFAAHEVRVCINQGRVLDDARRPKDYTEQQYLRSAEEMAALFADIPEALENSVEIAKRCSLTLTLGKNYLPDFPTPDGMTINDLIIAESEKGLLERLQHHKVPDEVAYHERLKIELDVITQMGFSGYFMIVADFIQWAKNHGIPVGPGRGSGAGSLVAYVLKITDLDPIEFELLFERFLNPERVSMPDFDIDFCMDRRDEVIDYVADHYGRDQVSQIITYGSMAAKAVIRDVGRVLSLGYGFVDRLAKMIPTEVGITLSDALKNSSDMQQAYNNEEDVKTLIDMALILEGTARNAGKHAGGVVIAPTKLTDFTPLYCDHEGNNLVTQFDKSDVESVGLVKFDFLGLRTLTIIDWALQTIDAQNAKKGLPPVDISQIPRDDFASYDLLKKGLTTAVFQLESRGMKELIKKLLPDCFNDIIALVALFRPGPLESGMVDDYVNVKHKRKAAEYAHPILEPILEPTNGVILYQEQVMQIARELSGYTLGGADILRRAMGKKDSKEMANQRAVFVSGAIANQVTEDTANYVFDLVDKFSGYGFNKTVAKNTRVRTIAGDKNIEDCHAGDVVFSMNVDGSVVQSNVVALHDHGNVPLWLVEFDDDTQEKCTLDHKWLTDEGQVPLWKILQMGNQVWGNRTETARHFDSSKTMSDVHESNSHGSQFRQRHRDVLWRNCENTQKSQRTFSIMRGVSCQTARNSGANLQRFGAYGRNAATVFRNGKENSGSLRYSRTTLSTIEKLAFGKSRKVRCDSRQGSCVTEIVKNGNVFRAVSGRKGFYTQCAAELWRIENAQTSRFCSQKTKSCNRSGWSLALFADSFSRTISHRSIPRPFVTSRNYETQLAVNSIVDGMFQRQHGRIDCTDIGNTVQQNRRQNVDRGVVFRKPIRATFLGWHQGYDLEVDHPEHNFLLASGLCCSNSHSAAYALVAYQTAWLKAHYPAAFMAAVLSADMDNTDKIVINIEECRALNIKIVPPSINYSDFKFTVNDNGELVYGLGALKGAGEAALLDMIEERKKNGLFLGLYDLCQRVDLRKFNKRVSEALIKAGALDEFDSNRAAHLAELPTALQIAEHKNKMKLAGQSDLFGLGGGEANEEESATPTYSTTVDAWSDKVRFAEEKAILGLFLTGHPIDQYADELRKLAPKKLSQLINEISPGRRSMPVRVAGLAIDIGSRQNKQGKSRGFAILDDNTARLEIVAHRENYDQNQAIFTNDYKDRLLIIEGNLALDAYLNVPMLTVDKIYPIEAARKTLQLTFKNNAAQFEKLAAILQTEKGGETVVEIAYFGKNVKATLRLGNSWRVKITDELLHELKIWLGKEAIQLSY